MTARRVVRCGAVAAAALLVACGFHLQGRAALPAVMKRPYLEAPDVQSEFAQSLRHSLVSSGAQLMVQKDKASAVVSILSDNVRRRVLSVSATNQPAQYEVSYTVGFAVSAGDQQLLAPQELTATRVYSFDERLLLAKGHEEDVLRQDLAHDLADRVMRRLSSL